MVEEVLEKKLSILGINSKLSEKLNNNNINKVFDLWVLKRKDLKNILSDKEISEVIIRLQLNSLDLNKRIYKNK